MKTRNCVRVIRDWGYGHESTYETPWNHFEGFNVPTGEADKTFLYVAGYVIPTGGKLTLEAT